MATKDSDRSRVPASEFTGPYPGLSFVLLTRMGRQDGRGRYGFLISTRALLVKADDIVGWKVLLTCVGLNATCRWCAGVEG